MSPYYAVQAVVAFAALVVAFRMGETREAARQQRERDARTDKLYRGVTRNGFVGSGAWPIALPPDPYKASFGPPLASTRRSDLPPRRGRRSDGHLPAVARHAMSLHRTHPRNLP